MICLLGITDAGRVEKMSVRRLLLKHAMLIWPELAGGQRASVSVPNANHYERQIEKLGPEFCALRWVGPGRVR